MPSFGAVAPGTDLSQHARELVRIHDAVLSGARPPERPRALVARSWARVMGLGLAADRVNQRRPLPTAELERRRRTSRLSLVVDELRRVLTSVADASMFLVVVTDADGVVLWREGSARVQRTADRLGFLEGMDWTEQVVGTNAIGTALAEAAPVQLFSAEHFEAQQHPWYCTAAPVHDPRDGTLLGVVDVSGPALTLHPAIGALVESAVRLAEGALWRQHQEGLEALRRSTESVVSTTSGPLLVVDDHGWVAHRTGVAVRDRIDVPQADRPVAVPGLGLCLPERLGAGWLVRPHDRATTIHATLTGTVLEVHADGGAWRAVLTPRHAQILRLLATGPMTAAVLSTRLFGDDAHVVTARAEVSRLRRVVGALVATGPYRLADGVLLTPR
ncbi:GAF domain-containing protein [Nocardioides anomalus]|uniref:GAF domain-containing protein n=1 Tax=Nocardioides anomalus TaxID=2712223 RepID=A0A6G6WI50_9ACTN|nr:GAF domain-containing protein [Nocardioides anomalus]QIG45011.1 GAF domain-containing protein [Nocardioides anomalus]